MALRRKVKSVYKNLSAIETKVGEATSNDPWGPSSSLMGEIADATYNVTAFSEIMGMLWKRLNDHGKNWRHVYKSLTVLEYIIKTGSERVAQQCRENIYAIQTLKDFQYIDKDGKDQGMNVREKSKNLVALLKDDDRLKNERQRAIKAKERFAQSQGGVGNSNFKGNKRFGSGQPTLGGTTTTTQDDISIPSSRSWEVDKPTEFDRRSADGRFSSDLEKARPSNEAEEEMQLQIALQISKEEAAQEKKLQQGDEERFKIALRESQHKSKQAVPFLTPPGQAPVQTPSTLLDLSEPNAQFDPAPAVSLDPWGAPAVDISLGPPAADPWVSQPSSTLQESENIWGTQAPPMQMSTQVDPWNAPSQPLTVAAPDPWSSTSTASNTFDMINTSSSLTNGFDPRGLNNHPQVQPSANPFDMSSVGSTLPTANSLTGIEAKGSFLGENSRLVNLDNILGDDGNKAPPLGNPFAVNTAPKGSNPFLQDKPKPKSINELRVQQTAFPSAAPQDISGGDILLPAPLIPDSSTQGSNVPSTNPFI